MFRKKGFTLIEIIMSIVLLGIIAVSMGIFSLQQMKGVADSGEYTSALNLARFELETVNNLSYTSVTSLTTNNYKSYPYTVIRTVGYVFGDDLSAENLKQITIQVRKSNSSTNLVTLVTYRAKNITFGL